MTDSVVEGDWRWVTDSTPVIWKNWADWATYPDPPNGGTAENCAVMLKQFNKHVKGHSTKAWGDYICDEPEVQEMTVVCEKEKGEDIIYLIYNILTVSRFTTFLSTTIC